MSKEYLAVLKGIEHVIIGCITHPVLFTTLLSLIVLNISRNKTSVTQKVLHWIPGFDNAL